MKTVNHSQENNNIVYNRGINSRFMVTLLSVITLIIASPPLYNQKSLRMFMVGGMLLWLIVAIFSNPRINLSKQKNTILVIMFILISVLYYYIRMGSLINERITRIYYYCFYVIAFDYIEKSQYKNYTRVFWAILMIAPIWLIISIYNGMMVPFLFRGMSGSGIINTSSYYAMGVVGYDYIYAIVVAMPLFLGLSSKHSNLIRWQRIVVIFNFFLNVTLIYLANYGLAFFALLLGLLLYTLYPNLRDRKANVIITLLLTLLILVIILNIESILLQLITHISNSYYVEKIMPIYRALSTEENFGRADIWLNALKEILRNPIFGSGFSGSGVNTHSEILYALVYYGVFIGGLEIVILLSPFKGCNFKNGVSAKINRATVFVFLFVVLFNPSGTVLGPIMFAMFKIGQYYVN